MTRRLVPIIVFGAVLAGASFTGAAVPAQGLVEGEVVQVYPTVMVVRSEQGHATILQITPRTQMGAQFKPGDKIVAYVTPYGVSSIQLKTTAAAIP